MKRGFTLIELLITIIILGILVTIVAPKYTVMVEKARADQAITYLRVMRTGEKIYYASNTRYVACASALPIRENLGVEITEESYLFSITSSVPTTFLATAIRKKNNTTITLDQDGTWGGTSSYRP